MEKHYQLDETVYALDEDGDMVSFKITEIASGLFNDPEIYYTGYAKRDFGTEEMCIKASECFLSRDELIKQKIAYWQAQEGDKK